jgi:hypothetical protein
MNATLDDLDLDLSNLDAPVSSRATQASVNDVHNTLREVARDVSALLEGDASSLTTRVQIEQQLAQKGTLLSVFTCRNRSAVCWRSCATS